MLVFHGSVSLGKWLSLCRLGSDPCNSCDAGLCSTTGLGGGVLLPPGLNVPADWLAAMSQGMKWKPLRMPFLPFPFSSFRLVFLLVPHLIYLLRERIPNEAEQMAVT